MGGIPTIRVYVLNDTNRDSPSEVNVSTLDAGAFGLSHGLYTHPEMDTTDSVITGAIFDASIDLLFLFPREIVSRISPSSHLWLSGFGITSLNLE